MPVKFMECGPKCRSRTHAFQLNVAVSKGTLREVQCYCSLCYNGAQLCDMYGRSALHMASSCGKVDVVEWLLEEKRGDVTQKDSESGWTSLHRALFYGQLATGRLLIQFKSDLYTRDHEGLGPLDIVMKDRALVRGIPPAVYDIKDRHEVFTWGDNSNFTLGHVSEQRRHIPEVVDEFRKHGINMMQIVMCKYHTVFLTAECKVYTCGHGLGGRLGHPTEETCLVPRQIECMSGETCMEVAAARDHTLLLTAGGIVYSCGMNDYHQLGQVPVTEKCLVPRPVNCKSVKGRTIKGICAGRFHSVLYTSDSVFTCGLNAGQLGHPKAKGDRKISQLKQVSTLIIKNLIIVTVNCSDAATIVLTEAGEIYVLHEYQCRKIASNRLDIERLFVVGGNLDHADSQILRENGGQQLIISFLNQSGKVFIWREKSPSLKRAHWMVRRLLHVRDFILAESSMGIVTEDGEVFVGTLSYKPPPVREVAHSNKESTEGEFGRMSLIELLMQEEIEEIQVHRITNIHRATYITADKKGHNYATIQSLPNCNLTEVPVVSRSEMSESFRRLLDESDEYDLIHDVILQVNDQRWQAHKFILVNRCANFLGLLVSTCQTDNETAVPVIDICDVHPQILEQLLTYVYTDTCELLSVGAKFSLTNNNNTREEIFQIDLEENYVDDTDYHKVSAFQVHHQKSKKQKGNKGRKDAAHQKNSQSDNPVKLLQDVSRKWGVKGLSKRLDCVRYHQGYIQSSGKPQPRSTLQFYREKLQSSKSEMYDISIKSEDDVTFQCHKCVLVARLEYFNSMLASGWMETSSTSALTLPIPGDILEILLDYLYTDESRVVNTTQNVEFLCNILVVADQMLVTRLKEMCEASIAVLITLKNVGELLEFASTYNAGQLKTTCQQYIVINLSAVLEGRYLDVLTDDVIDELTKYYRQSIENMSRRFITPFDEGPDKVFLEALAADDIEASPSGVSMEPKKTKSKKKRNRTKSTTDEQDRAIEKGLGQEKGTRQATETERQLSVSSDIKSDEDTGTETLGRLIVECKTESRPTSATSPVGPWGRGFTPVSPTVPSGVWSHPTETGLQSPGSDGPSLRDIMLQEKPKRESGSSSHSGQKSEKFSWKQAKKQQQMQQMEVKRNRNNSSNQSETGSNINQSTNTEKSSAACPWGSLNKVVKSFRSLMVEEQSAHGSQTFSAPIQKGGVSKPTAGKSPASKSQTGNTNVVSWGLPKNRATTPKVSIVASSKKVLDDGPASPRSPENPWMGATAQSPTDTACSFSEIIRDELHKTDVLIKSSNKPLALIQIEEQAIQDLLKHYKADEAVDEYITVERVVQVAAAPLWKRERLQSY